MRKKSLLLLLGTSFLFVSASASASPIDIDNIIINEKKIILDKKVDYFDKVNSKNITSWVSDVNLMMSNSYAPGDLSSRTYSISYDQPIYIGGNIWKGVEYSKKEEKINLMLVKKEKDQIIYSVLDKILTINKLKLSKKTIQLSLKANAIELKRKKELYRAGTLDITFVSDLIIKQNLIKNQDIDVTASIIILKRQLGLLTSFTYEELISSKVLSSYISLMDKDTFMSKNTLSIDRSRLALSRLDTEMNRNNLLPTLSVNVSAYDTKDTHSQDNGYYGGFKLSVPLSLNRYKSLQVSKVKELMDNSVYIDKYSSEEVFYENKVNEIRTLQQKVGNINQAISEYDKLIVILEQDFKLGLSVKYDLDILEINKQLKISEKEEEINNIKQKTLEIVSHTVMGR